MATKTSTKRVFELARELGVSSKDIIAKCEAEQIPGITNHMSAVSLGLAATIHEWFGDAEAGAATAVETADPVDLEAAKARAATRRRATRKQAEPRATASRTETPEPKVVEPPAPKTLPPLPVRQVIPQEPPAARPEEAPVESPPAVPERPAAAAAASPGPAVPATEPQGPTDDAAEIDADDPDARAVPNVPVRPDVTGPVGPMLQQPRKTALAGPKIVRIEAPEVAPVPGRRPRETGGIPRGGARTGRGVGVGPASQDPGMPTTVGRGGSSRRNKRRATPTGRGGEGAGARTGRTGSAGENRAFNWREADLVERERRLNRASGFIRAARRDSQKRQAGGGHRATTAAQAGGAVRIEEPITIKSLSSATGLKVNDIMRKLVQSGAPLVGPDAPLETETAREVVMHWEIELDVVEKKSAEELITEEFEAREMSDEQPRSPVVTILGHVDHGKTTLLDKIRNANVAAGEAGGITQATSAFRVPVRVGDGQRMVTFIDTPGHEAFTEMRARGAKVTDIVVLVVAADDGVMPQTIESISHAKAAEVPIIVALNKVDKPEATDSNIQRIFGQLAEQGLNPVEWGGTTELVRISALKGEGIQEILDLIDYQAQLLELTADFGGAAQGTVIESQMEEGRGAVARVLVQQGRLKKGDYVVVGRAYGRVRDIVNDRGERVAQAEPGDPIAISGINEVPDAGDKFYAVKNLRAAEAAAEERKQSERNRDLAKEKITLDNIFSKLAESERKELPLVVKADVQGSLETLRATLGKIGSDEVSLSIKHSAVGGVNESDVGLAEAAGAIILGFNVTSSGSARRLAEARGVDIRFYDVIYDLTDDVTRAAEGLLEPELKLEVLGHAEVREVFKVSKVGMIAGCYVTDGSIQRHAQIRVTRGGIVVEKDRRLEQLKRFKDDVKEVNSGQECGMRIEGYDDIRQGDVLECYRTREVRRTLG